MAVVRRTGGIRSRKTSGSRSSCTSTRPRASRASRLSLAHPSTLRLSRSLVVQTSFLGDVILTTPLLSELAGRGTVDVVATRLGASLLAGHPSIRHLHVYDKRGEDAGVSGFRRLAKLVHAESRADVAYLAQGSPRSAALALAAGFATRIGFATSAGRWLYTARIPYREGRHHAERLLSLAGEQSMPNEAAVRPRLYPSADDESAVDALLRAAGVATGEPLIALAPGSVWHTKRWPYFPALARLLPADARIVVVGSAGDSALAREILDVVGPRAIDATGQLSLLASAALIGRSRVIVTNDSAPLHMATAMNTPTVALFGPTVPRFGFGPLASQHALGELVHLGCRPCHAHGPMRCPLTHFRCMRDLTAEHVYALATSLERT